MRPAQAIAVVAAALALASCLSAGGAGAGYVTGVGDARTATLFDPSGNASVLVHVPEVLDGAVETTLSATTDISSAPPSASYDLALVVSPDDPELRAEWATAVDTSPASSGSTFRIVVPAEALPYRIDNVPFALELRDGAGAVLDSVEFSMDLTYHPPPPDGGLFQLAAGTVAAWGLVLLYAVGLHRAHKRLLARADSLERAMGRSGREGEK